MKSDWIFHRANVGNHSVCASIMLMDNRQIIGFANWAYRILTYDQRIRADKLRQDVENCWSNNSEPKTQSVWTNVADSGP